VNPTCNETLRASSPRNGTSKREMFPNPGFEAPTYKESIEHLAPAPARGMHLPISPHTCEGKFNAGSERARVTNLFSIQVSNGGRFKCGTPRVQVELTALSETK
jgi:hypothetical protein